MLLWWDATNLIYGSTNNPFDLSRIAGGSSGGEAALLTSAGTLFSLGMHSDRSNYDCHDDMIPFLLGSDLGGSIRIPSSFCGVFGHKPSPYVVSCDGMWPEIPPPLLPYGTFGPLSRYASELKIGLKAMAIPSALKFLKLDDEVDLTSLKVYLMESEVKVLPHITE